MSASKRRLCKAEGDSIEERLARIEARLEQIQRSADAAAAAAAHAALNVLRSREVSREH